MSEFGLLDFKETLICGIKMTINRLTPEYHEKKAQLDEKYPSMDKMTEDQKACYEVDRRNLMADTLIRNFEPFMYEGKRVAYSQKNARTLMQGPRVEVEATAFVLNLDNFATKIKLDFDFTKKK